MGYFASLVPKTALAKEPSLPHWGAGGVYFGDFFETYHLWLPFIICSIAIAALLVAARDRREWGRFVAVAVPAIAALAYITYVVRMGGDFRHGRFLLIGLFAFSMPISVVALTPFPLRGLKSLAAAAAMIAMLGWSLISVLFLQPYYSTDRPNSSPYDNIGVERIADTRRFHRQLAGVPNPVTFDDFRNSSWGMDGLRFREQIDQQPRRLLLHQEPAIPLSSSVSPQVNGIGAREALGVFAWFAGPSIHVVDLHGLSDPIASRLLITRRTGRPGHEKVLPPVWIKARFGAPEAVGTDPAVAVASEVLNCPRIRELLEAVEAPLTPARFLENIRLAPSLTTLRIPSDPVEAQKRFCP
jgi:arabinofuranosyltransferase